MAGTRISRQKLPHSCLAPHVFTASPRRYRAALSPHSTHPPIPSALPTPSPRLTPSPPPPQVPKLNVSYKPQKIAPSFEGTVRMLLHNKIREAFIHPQVGHTRTQAPPPFCISCSAFARLPSTHRRSFAPHAHRANPLTQSTRPALFSTDFCAPVLIPPPRRSPLIAKQPSPSPMFSRRCSWSGSFPPSPLPPSFLLNNLPSPPPPTVQL